MNPTQPHSHRFAASSLFTLVFAGGTALAIQGAAPRTFDRVLLLESTSETSASVSLGDIDGNRTLDVVLAKGRHWPLNDVILRNDGKADLFVPHRDGGQNLVFWNDGTGTFTDPPAAVGPAKSQVRAAAAADINGDGTADLVAGDEKNGMFVYLGAGKRVFDAPVALAGATGAPYSIAIADLNRDGSADLVVGRQEAVGSVLFNLGGGRLPKFADTPWGDGKGSVYGVAIGDLDGDGWPDIAAARSGAPNGIWFSGVAR